MIQVKQIVVDDFVVFVVWKLKINEIDNEEISILVDIDLRLGRSLLRVNQIICDVMGGRRYGIISLNVTRERTGVSDRSKSITYFLNDYLSKNPV